jgi:pimeloyl-ACP methyl ester carboxylesterase
VFAATFPERVSHLVLFGSFARFSSAPGYLFRPTGDEIVRGIDDLWAGAWGTGVSIRHFLPSYASNPDVARQYAKLERLAFSPGALKMWARYNIEIDVGPFFLRSAYRPWCCTVREIPWRSRTASSWRRTFRAPNS